MKSVLTWKVTMFLVLGSTCSIVCPVVSFSLVCPRGPTKHLVRPRSRSAINESSSPLEPQIQNGANNISKAVRVYHFFRPVVEHSLRVKKRGRIGGRVGRKRWMDSPAFQGLTNWAFSVCDANSDGLISRDDLYSGILLVHLHLAKFVGIAACQPLNRTQVNELFDIAASKTSGKIGKKEFEDIVVLSCARMTSRLFIYWAALVALVPVLTTKANSVLSRITNSAISFFGIKNTSHLGPVWIFGVWLVEHVISVISFAVMVPWLYNRIDFYFAERRKEAIIQRQRPLWEAFREKYVELVQQDIENG